VQAHGGRIALKQLGQGIEVVVTVPIEGAGRDGAHAGAALG
jgi:hypothetical protein